MLRSDKFPLIMKNKIQLRSVPSSLQPRHQTDSGTFGILHSWKAKLKRLSADYTAHLIPSHPRTSQNRDGRSLTHNKRCNPESHSLIPSATMALVV